MSVPSSRTLPLLSDESKATDEECRVGPPRLRWYHWVIIVLTDIIGPFSTDAYIPNLPEMKKELSATAVEAGLSLQANWLAKGLGTLVIGAMADSRYFGRRAAILLAFVFFVSGAFGSAQVPRSHVGAQLLIVTRVIQGIGESGTVVCTAIARDVLVNVSERVRVMAILGTLRPLAIVCAPSLGGLLGAAFGWRNVFRALAGWGAVLFVAVSIFIPETRPIETQDGGGVSFEGFGIVIRRLVSGDPDASLALGAIIVLAFGFAGVLSFLSNISILLEGRFDLGVIESSLLIGSVPCVIIANNAVVARLFGKEAKSSNLNDQNDRSVYTSVRIINASLDGLLLSGISFIVLGAAPFRSQLRNQLPPFLASIFLFAYVQSVAVGPIQALAIQPFGDCAGAAAATNNIVSTYF